jgi:hypothetical protein
MLPSTAQATLTNILLSGVPTYGHTAPSPPPGLTPVDVHINSMQTEGKNISASINGHVQVTPSCEIQGVEGGGGGCSVLLANEKLLETRFLRCIFILFMISACKHEIRSAVHFIAWGKSAEFESW